MPAYKYWVFISYSHEDRGTARRFKRQLQRIKIDAQLIEQATSPPAPESQRRVFLDQDDLAKDGRHLPDAIREELTQAQKLLVLCSPSAAGPKSHVNLEIQEFVNQGRASDVHPVIISGHPNDVGGTQDCFPPSLRKSYDQHGNVTGEQNPLCPDFRKGIHFRKKIEWANLLSAIIGVSRELLYDPVDQAKKRETLRRAGLVAVLVAAAVIILLVSARLVERSQQLTISEFEVQVAKAKDALANGNNTQAIIRILKVWPKTGTNTPQLASRRDAIDVLSDAISAQREIRRIPGKWLHVAADRLGTHVYLGDADGRVVSVNVSDWQVVDLLEPINDRADFSKGPSVQLDTTGLQVSSNGRWVVQTFRSLPMTANQPGDLSDRKPDEEYFDGLLVTDLQQQIPQQARGWWSPGDKRESYTVAVNESANRAAMVTGTAAFVWDLITGDPLPIEPMEFQDNHPPQAVAFSSDGQELGIAFGSGTVLKMDLAEGIQEKTKISGVIHTAIFDEDLWSLVAATSKDYSRDTLHVSRRVLNSPAAELRKLLGVGDRDRPLELDPAFDVVISPSGKMALNNFKKLTAFNVDTEGGHPVPLVGARGYSFAWVGDGLVAAVFEDYTSIFRVSSDYDASKLKITGSPDPISFSQDGSAVLLKSAAGVHVYQLEAHRQETYGEEWGNEIIDAALSPDNSLLAVITKSADVILFDLTSGVQTVIHTALNHRVPASIEFLESKNAFALSLKNQGLMIFEKKLDEAYRNVWKNYEIKTGEVHDLEYKNGDLRIVVKETDRNLWVKMARNIQLSEPVIGITNSRLQSATRIYEDYSNYENSRVFRNETQRFVVGYNYVRMFDTQNMATTFDLGLAPPRDEHIPLLSYDGRHAVLFGINARDALLLNLPIREGTIFDVACDSLPFSPDVEFYLYDIEASGDICTGRELQAVDYYSKYERF